jgi:hypothetical protein
VYKFNFWKNVQILKMFKFRIVQLKMFNFIKYSNLKIVQILKLFDFENVEILGNILSKKIVLFFHKSC